jgi:hypothetical protein
MVTLTFGTRVLELRNPDFGDTESVDIRRINRRLRGGDPVLFRDPMWPRSITYTWKWSFLSQADLTRLLDFMRASLGQEITIVDYEGVTHAPCIITTPSEEVSQDGVEDYKAGLSFQVEL